MIEINLAPGAEPRRRSAGRRATLRLPAFPGFADSRALLLGGGALLLLLAVGYQFWSLSARESELRAQVDQAVADSTRFATTIGLVQALQARQDTIARKIEIIREVDQRRYVWPHLLDEISASVPAYTWLSEIRHTEPRDSADAAVGFLVQGNAGSTLALTRFMKNLEASAFIRDVTLVTSEQTEVEGRALQRFSLEARWETPDSSAVETVPIVTLR